VAKIKLKPSSPKWQKYDNTKISQNMEHIISSVNLPGARSNISHSIKLDNIVVENASSLLIAKAWKNTRGKWFKTRGNNCN